VQEAALAEQPLPLIVLGDPGMGKSQLLRELGGLDGYEYLTAAQFLRRPLTSPSKGVLLLDALDEVSAGKDTDPLERVLSRLGEAGWPEFAISCRAADWRGSTRAKAIADDYGRPVRILTLEPINESDSIALLEAKLGVSQARLFYEALDHQRLAGLLSNPQTLLMLIEIADDGIPASRADLFDRAVRKMITEHNEEHVQSALNQLDTTPVLDGAGAAMAIMLLSGKEGIFNGLQTRTPEPLQHIASLASLPLSQHCGIALRSRLFRTSGEDHSFKDCHRTVAEYLGARWLGRVVEASADPALMVKRLLALMRSNGRVPASLRGLHAWLACASQHFAREVIAADPYGVLRYADFGTVTVDRANLVWDSFEHHGQEDPWFRGGYWHSFSVAGLVQAGLGKRLAALLDHPLSSFHLRSLVLELLGEGACVPEIVEDLVTLIKDGDRHHSERHDALMILARRQDVRVDWPELLTGLGGRGDPDASRLIDQAFGALGVDLFSDVQVGDILLGGYDGFADAAQRNKRSRLEDRSALSCVVPVERCASVLDVLSERFGHGSAGAAFVEHDPAFGHLIWTLIGRQIPSGNPDPVRLWTWLDAFAEVRLRETGPRCVVAAWLAGNAPLRRAVQAQILLTEAGLASQRLRHWPLGGLSTGLCVQEEDGLELLRQLEGGAHDSAVAAAAMEVLIGGWNRCCDWTPRLAAAAAACAAANPALRALLDPPRRTRDAKTSTIFEGLAEEQRRSARERETRRRSDRDNLLARRDSVRQGQGPAARLALCFLGSLHPAGRDRPAQERIGAWAGGDLHEDAMAGFEASLRRPIGRSLHEVTSRLLKRDNEDDPVWPVVAGLAERHRSGIGFGAISEEHMLAGLLAKRISLTVADEHLQGFGEALEAYALADEGRFERFLRALIEPQLGSERHYISGTHYMLGGKEHRDLRARLLLEWLDDFESCLATDRETLVQALLDVPQGMQREAGRRIDGMIAEAQPRADGEDRKPYWTALRILRDFGAARRSLEIAALEPAFLWSVRKAISQDHPRHGRIRPLPPERLVWVFERFAGLWPETPRPEGVTSGSRNPWDASEFLHGVIFRLAEDTSLEAIRSLHNLTERNPTSYGEALRAARSKQRGKVAEQQYVPHETATIAAAILDAAPRKPADVKAIALDAIARVQARISGSATDTVNLFYDGDRPKDEEPCRNALLDLLGPELPHGIVVGQEEAMPGRTRADAGFRLGRMRVPLEAKLAWNQSLWTACDEQLDRLYASADHLAGGQGIYLVFWFGSRQETGHKIRRSPKGDEPSCADELEAMLRAELPAGAGDRLSVVVLDLARRREQKRAGRTGRSTREMPPDPADQTP
jgi:hypothetical protein